MRVRSSLLHSFLVAVSLPSVISHFTFQVPANVKAGDSVNINWAPSVNPSNLPFTILLKQGDISRVQTQIIIRILNSGDAPNTGSFAWNVPEDLPEAANYYIRLQTGLPTDWKGGLAADSDNAEPTPDGVYGYSNYITLQSSIQSTSYASPTFSITSNPPMTPVSTSSTSSSNPLTSASPNPSTSDASPNVDSTTSHGLGPGKIAGTVLGVIGLLLLGLLALLNLSQLKYWFSSLAFALFGAFLLPSRRLIFRAAKDLGRTQITLVVEGKAGTADSSTVTSKQVFWRVFHVGNNEPEFILDIPCQNNCPALAFATINDSPHGLVCDAPFPGSAVMAHGPNGNITLSPGNPNAKFSIRSNIDIPQNLALGTFVIETSGESHKKAFYPFLVDNVGSGDTFEPNTTLYIHAFETSDCAESTYAEEDRLSNRLTPEEGIDLSSLHPLSIWHFSRRSNGKGLVLKIDRSNGRKSIKDYQNVCKVSNEVMCI